MTSLKGLSRFFLITLIYSCFATLALRGFLFKTGVLGHNWDWSIFPLGVQLISVSQASFYLWDSTLLGTYKYINSPNLFFYFLGILGNLGLNGNSISKVLPFVTLVISGLTMFYLVEDILKKNSDSKLVFPPAFLGAIFYSLSPYIFNDIIGGAATQFLTYAFFPLAVYFLRKIEDFPNKFLYVSFLTLTLTIISFSFQRLFLISIILFTYAFFSEKPLPVYKNLLKVYILFTFLNSYWIYFILKGGVKTGIAFGSQALILSTIKNNVPRIDEAFVGLGYFRDFFKYSIDPKIYIFWYLSSYGLLIVAVLSFLIFKKLRQKETLFWMLLFLFSLIFSTGGRPPFGNLVLWIYKNIPLMVLFKGPQHLLILSTFSLSAILGLGFFVFLSKLGEKNIGSPILCFIFLFIPLMIWISPFLTGNLGLNYLLSLGGGNFVDTYTLSPGYKKIFSVLGEDRSLFRILFLPMADSPYFLKTEYQNEGQGGDPLYSSPWRIVSAGANNSLTQRLESNIYNVKNQEEIRSLIGVLGIKYVILRKDVVPIFGEEAEDWNYSRVSRYLASWDFLKLISSYDYVNLYKVIDYEKLN